MDLWFSECHTPDVKHSIRVTALKGKFIYNLPFSKKILFQHFSSICDSYPHRMSAVSLCRKIKNVFFSNFLLAGITFFAKLKLVQNCFLQFRVYIFCFC